MPEKDYLTQLVFAIIKCSAISANSKEALDISTELYKDCYEYAEKTKQVTTAKKETVCPGATLAYHIFLLFFFFVLRTGFQSEQLLFGPTGLSEIGR